MALTLTKHFEERWREYFHEAPPSSFKILQIINQSLWLQRCRVLYEADGTPYKLLATYWDPQRNIIIKIDWLQDQVVTVIVPERKKKAGTRSRQPESRRIEG